MRTLVLLSIRNQRDEGEALRLSKGRLASPMLDDLVDAFCAALDVLEAQP